MSGEPSDRSLIRRYYFYRATLSVGFITPIFTLFLLRSLTFTEVGALSAIYSTVSVVGEVPTGYVGDRLGRRASLLLSVAFTVASLAGFLVAEQFIWFAILYILWAIALTFRSGSMDAWLYDTLDERLDTTRFSHVRGRGDAVQNWIGALTMVFGGLLYGIAPTAPFLAAVVFNSLGFLTLLSLPKNRQYAARGDSDETSGRLGPRGALRIVRQHLARPPLRSLLLYVGLFYGVVGVAHTYVQPMTIETLGPVAAAVGVEMPAGGAAEAARSGEAGAALALGLGVMYAGLSAVSALGGYYAGAIENRLGVRRAVLLVPAVAAVALLIPVWVALMAIPTFVAMRTSTPLLRPIANGYINDHVSGVGRATLLSAASMFYMTLRTPLALGAGMIADASTATVAVASLGGLFLVGGGVVWILGTVAPSQDGTEEQAESQSAT